MDADACITNHDVTLQGVVGPALPTDPGASLDAVFTLDVNGFNAGSFLVRTGSARVRAVFEWVLSVRGAYDFPPFWEQTPLGYQLWHVAAHVGFVPQRVMNSYPDYGRGNPGDEVWRPGDFVFHCPGLPVADKLRLLAAKVGAA